MLLSPHDNPRCRRRQIMHWTNSFVNTTQRRIAQKSHSIFTTTTTTTITTTINYPGGPLAGLASGDERAIGGFLTSGEHCSAIAAQFSLPDQERGNDSHCESSLLCNSTRLPSDKASISGKIRSHHAAKRLIPDAQRGNLLLRFRLGRARQPCKLRHVRLSNT